MAGRRIAYDLSRMPREMVRVEPAEPRDSRSRTGSGLWASLGDHAERVSAPLTSVRVDTQNTLV